MVVFEEGLDNGKSLISVDVGLHHDYVGGDEF